MTELLSSPWTLPLRWPLAGAVEGVTRLRNYAYDRGWLPSTQFSVPVLGIGNLSVGGTGKTPATDRIVEQLMAVGRRVAVLSRGYRRRTRGFRWVHREATPDEVGDEPLLLKLRHPDRIVAVCEDRVAGIERLLAEYPSLELVVLDDAFQHRRLHCGRYLLLTTWNKPFFRDHVLPWGHLREGRAGKRRAAGLLVTRVPPQTSGEEQEAFARRAAMPPGVPVFFSRMEYTGLHPFEPEAEPPSWEVLARLRLLLVTGIADPVAMRRMLARRGVFPVENQVFRDHHQFQENELALIAHKALRQKIDRIITTEKDYFRLRHLPGIAQWAAFRPLFPRMELTLLDTSNTAFYNWIGHYAERN